MPKKVNLLAGVLLACCGVLACFYPQASADYYGLGLERLEAKTTIRVVGGFFAGIGILFLIFACRLQQQKNLLLCLAVVMASFSLPRILGLYLDGLNQTLMIYELLFELIFLTFVVWVYRRDESRCKNK